MRSAPMMKTTDNSELHLAEEGAVLMRYKEIRPSNSKDEMGYFPYCIGTGKSLSIFARYWRH